MMRCRTRGLLVSAALLLGTVGGTAAVSAATVSPSVHAQRHPLRNFWRHWRRTHPRNLYAVESVSSGGGLFGEGELVVQTATQRTLTINLDNMSRAYRTRGLRGGRMDPIPVSSLAPGDFVVIRSEVIDVRSTAPTNNDGLVLLALTIDFTGFNGSGAPTPTITPSATPTPTPTPTAAPGTTA